MHNILIITQISWPQFIYPNPVDGQLHLTKSRVLSYRCDAAICKFIRELFEKSFPWTLKNFFFILQQCCKMIWVQGRCPAFKGVWGIFYKKSLKIWHILGRNAQRTTTGCAYRFRQQEPTRVDSCTWCPYSRRMENKDRTEIFRAMPKTSRHRYRLKNPSHMNRLPGCIRKETGQWQRLLYLNPEAGVDTDLL